MKPTAAKLTPLDFLEQAGFDRKKLLKIISGGNAPDPEHTALKNKFLVDVLPAAVTLSKDPSTALRLGQQVSFSSLGVFGFALRSCSTLRQALNLLHRYHPLLRLGVYWEISAFEDELALRFSIDRGNPEQQRLMTELAFSHWFCFVRALVSKTTPATEVHVNYPKPDHYKNYKKFIPVPVKFNQTYSQILLPEEALDTPSKTASPAEHVMFQQLCEEMLRGLNTIENTSTALRRLLIQSAGGFPNIDEVADQLHMSKSTLGRRLENESSSFRGIVDEVKNLLAKEYLTNTDLTVADIAHLLDYTDTANFRRAFVRWNNMTPSAFRENI